MKHFFNAKEDIVIEALDGLLQTARPGRLARLDTFPDIKVIVRADWDKSRVAVICGGGSGHEPSHSGYVGRGMLTAAVCGEIFASPTVDGVLTAIRAVTGPAGCLVVVKNYTGDRLNFGLAVEKARTEGFKVEMVIVADDIAIPGISQPRGVAGALFVNKIAGHLAENGADLATVAAAAKAAAADAISLGMSLSTCSIPGQHHEHRLGEDEGELGLGIHGEPGVERINVMAVERLVAIMADRLLAQVKGHGKQALLINNLGAVPPIEMSLIAASVLSSPLADHVKLIIGPAPMMTALNMNGFSLSLISLDAAREAALSSATDAPAWLSPVEKHAAVVLPAPKAPQEAAAVAASANAETERLLTAICQHLISLEAELNRLDARSGDGDTGSTVSTGARTILSKLPQLPLANASATASALGSILSTSMGGSSGVLLSIFFTATAKALQEGQSVAESLLSGLDRMRFYGGAAPGDRTMIDALEPGLKAYAADGLGAAAAAARAGADATKAMTRARAGRAAYVGARDLEGVADPGAVAVAAAFEVAARQS